MICSGRVNLQEGKPAGLKNRAEPIAGHGRFAFLRCLRGPGLFLIQPLSPHREFPVLLYSRRTPGFIRGICCIVTNYVEAASTRLENLIATYGMPEPLGECCEVPVAVRASIVS
jgi:hypothetical protein